jgi:hypothetical protein
MAMKLKDSLMGIVFVLVPHVEMLNMEGKILGNDLVGDIQ